MEKSNVIIDPKEEIIKGAFIISKAVGSTYGPKGKAVIIETDEDIIITKDGATVAKYVYSDNPLENIGIQLVRDASLQANKIAGDGSTTTTVLTHAFLEAYSKEKSVNIVGEVNNIVIPNLLKQVKPVTKEDVEILKNIATTSANGDVELGGIIGGIFAELDRHAVISIERGQEETYWKKVEGFTIDSQFTSKYFHDSTGQSTQVEYQQCKVVLINERISDINTLLPKLDREVPTVFVVQDIDESLVNTMLYNVSLGKIQCNILKYGATSEHKKSILKDAESIMGCEYQRVSIIDGKLFIHYSSNTKDIDARIDTLLLEIDRAKNDEVRLRNLKDRLANLKGISVMICVGCKSDVEYKEKYDRIEDAINATRATLEFGVVEGGGIALYNSTEGVSTNMAEVLKMPRKLLDVSVKSDNLDPYLVVKTAITTAASVADTILNSNICVTLNTSV